MAYDKKKLTKKEVSVYVKQYQERLPGWEMIQPDLLARYDTFVAQSIWFDRISGGEYRPTAYLSVLVAEVGNSSVGVLRHLLNVRAREASRQEHPNKFSKILEAMYNEFVPSLRVAFTTELAYRSIIDSGPKYHVNEAFALVCLAGAMGLAEDVKKWTTVFHEAQGRLALPCDEFDRQQQAFVDKVNSWMSLPDVDRVAIFQEISERNRARLRKL
jgi:hypothetical protein